MVISSMLLGIDYGLAKVGVAVGSMPPSMPLDVIRYKHEHQLFDVLHQVILSEKVDGLVIGWPADHLAITTPQTEKIHQFGDALSALVRLPVVYYPETLTTQIASQRMIEEGISKQRRRLIEDSYAAAAILDGYLNDLRP